MQMDDACRNAVANAVETTIGTSALLRVRTGAAPANLAAAASGTILLEIELESDWLANASGGSKAIAGAWQGTAVAEGTAGHWEVVSSDGTTRRLQGTISATGGGGEMTILDLEIVTDRVITVTSGSLGTGNA